MIKKFYTALFCLLFTFPFSNTQVFAAELTPNETNEVSRLQQEYAQLDNTIYNLNNLYLNKPQFKTKFKSGTLVPDYLNSQLAYTNFYRKLFKLTPVKENFQDNIAAQKTAAVLAALDANPMVNQHNLPYEKRPKTINKTTWQLARN
ncbi:MAG: CAP domain-containing protein, partial [Lactobacillus sp.]|nr:CAP domain-containing protein [Lactobacillus sp.]